jgi:hypothetical protein
MRQSTAGRTSSRVRTERTEVSLSDFEKELIRLQGDSEHWNGMVYGDSNVGKTVLAGTLPGRNFWLIGEPGYKSAANRGATGVGRRLTDSAMAWAAIEWLEYRERFRKFNWIILDGITTLDNRFRLVYANEAFDIDPTKRQHRNLPDRPDYFNTQNFWKSFIPRLVDMPVNVLITAHAFRTDKTDDGDLYVFPGIQGKVTEVANAISGLLDFVGFMEVHNFGDDRDKEFHNRILWRRTTRKSGVTIYAGDKTGKLGTGMLDPTFPKILRKLNSSPEEE